MSDKTKQMLAAMLNGKPTKEMEYIKALGSDDIKNSQIIKENVKHSNLPSAGELNYSPMDMKLAGKDKGLPPVSLDEINNLMLGKKGVQNKPNQPTQPQPKVIQEDYYAVGDLHATVNLNDDRFPSDEELHRQLMSKVPNVDKPVAPSVQMIREGVNPNKKQNSQISGVSKEEIKEMIEEVVYEVLADIIGEQNKNFDTKEQFKFLVGQTLFSGYIQKALEMPNKKKK